MGSSLGKRVKNGGSLHGSILKERECGEALAVASPAALAEGCAE